MAFRRPRRPAPLVDLADADDAVLGRPLRRAASELTGNDPGWHQLGGLRLASSQPRLEEIRRQAAWAKTFGLPMEIVSARGGAGALPADEHRRRARRRLHPGRRLPRPVAAHVLARRRCAPPRRADRDARPRHRASRRRTDGSPRSRPMPGRIECEVVVNAGRHVRARARAHGRRRPADHPVRPPVPDHRAVRPAARAAADAARSRQPRLFPHRGRRPRHGRLRAQACAVGARRDPRGIRGEAAPAGMGPHGGALRERDHARARDGDRRGEDVLQRAGGVHARRGLPARRDRRAPASGSRRAAARTGSPARAASAR